MSQLTSKTKAVYIAVLYDKDDNVVDESCDCYTPESAIENAKEMVAHMVKETGEYHFAKIETRVVPMYE